MDENHINSKEIEGQINLFSKKAESVVSDENKLRSLVNRAKKWLGKGKAIPVIGDVIDDLVTMIDLLSAMNEQIQNIAQKKDTLCRMMYN